MLLKSVIQNSPRAARSKWLILLVAVWIVAGFSNTAESTGNMISLNPAGVTLETIRVVRNADVEISNDSQITLHDFTIIQVASGKKMLSIEGLKPSASFNLAFDRAGTYIACYSQGSEETFSQSTCLQIEVVGFRSI